MAFYPKAELSGRESSSVPQAARMAAAQDEEPPDEAVGRMAGASAHRDREGHLESGHEVFAPGAGAQTSSHQGSSVPYTPSLSYQLGRVGTYAGLAVVETQYPSGAYRRRYP